MTISGTLSSHRIAHVVDKLKGRMNSRGVALAALTAASALLAYIFFRKREVNIAIWNVNGFCPDNTTLLVVAQGKGAGGGYPS